MPYQPGFLQDPGRVDTMPWSSSGTTATSESRAQHRFFITAPRLPHAQPAEDA